MTRKEFILSLVPVLAGFGQLNGQPPQPAPLEETLDAIRKKYELPGLAGAIVTSSGAPEIHVVGVRKIGTETAVTKEDRWHLGSNTKMMTATLAARLVEAGKLKWDSTLGEVFPKMSFEKSPGAKSVTLVQLLSHRSGFPGNFFASLYRGSTKPLNDQRMAVLGDAVSRPLPAEPGTKFEYSNLGYVIAGAMIEAVSGKTWEEAIRESIFKPLKMTGMGFGPVGTPGKNDQPWPHGPDGKPVPETGVLDNPAVIGPAGTAHGPMTDWAKFIADQLRGARGEKALLKPESYRMLQSAQAGGDYGLGWGVVERKWADGTALTHAGNNTMNLAVVWLAPKKNIALLACTNSGAKTANRALDETVVALLKTRVSL